MSDYSIIPSLIHQLDEAYHSKAWHGTNLRGSVRGLTLTQLSWRPSPKRHNIWELIVHCAYWKYIVRRRITGEPHGSFPLKGSNFFPRPDIRSVAQWRSDLRLLDDMHEQLITVVRHLPPKDLRRYPHGSQFSNLQTITGVAMHDVYHTGQIQLLKRLQR